MARNTNTEASGVTFLDSLPGITKEGRNGKWADTADKLRAQPNAWALVQGPITNPYSIVSNLNGGKAAGVDSDEFEFAARSLDVPTAQAQGLPTSEVEGETGYVFGRFIEGDVRVAVLAARNQRREKAAATRRERGTTSGRRRATEAVPA